MKFMSFIVILSIILSAALAIAAEDCSMLHGICRDACGENEEGQIGAFEDCGEQQECCAARDPAGDRINCCIYSFTPGKYGPLNCGSPTGNVCAKGSASPLACGKLKMCKEKKPIKNRSETKAPE